MTKQDYIKIAQAIKNFKEKEEQVVKEKSEDTFNPIEFLIDEFAYMLEKDNPLFNETKFRQFIYNL